MSVIFDAFGVVSEGVPGGEGSRGALWEAGGGGGGGAIRRRGWGGGYQAEGPGGYQAEGPGQLLFRASCG